jgi:hypothetical protein
MNATQTLTADGRPAPADASATPFWWRLHAPGICLALFLAAVLVGPRWYFLTTDPPEGVRVQTNVFGAGSIGLDEGLYGTLVRDAYDGELPIRDPYLSDDSGSVPQTGVFWNVVVGTLGHPLGSDARAMALVTTFAALTTFILLYVLSVRLTGSVWAAICAMAITLIVVYVLERSPGFLALRHWDTLMPLLMLDPQNELHIWSRYLAPALPLPLYLGAVLLVPGGVLDGRRWQLLGAGALLGLLIYTYLFYWVSFVLALGAWALWLAISGDRRSPMRIAILVGVAFLVALPELGVVAYNGMRLDAEAQERVGSFGELRLHTTWIRAILQRFVLGVPLIYLALRGPHLNRFYVCLYLAPLVPASTRDFLPQTDHFIFHTWSSFAIPLAIAGSVEGYRMLPQSVRPVATAAVGVCAVLGAVYFTAIQGRAANQIDETYAVAPDEYAALQWIERNLGEEDTVVTPSWVTTQQVALLTSASTYIASGSLTRIPNEEVADRYMRVSAAFGIDEDTVFYRIDPAREAPSNDRTVPRDALERHYDESSSYYLFNEAISRPRLITDHFPAWRQKYSGYLETASVLGAYDSDYLFCGHRERFWPLQGAAPGTWVEDAFRQDNAAVLRIVPEGTQGAREFAGCQAEGN